MNRRLIPRVSRVLAAIPRLLAGIAGCALLSLALLAARLGIDHNTEWGMGRTRVFALGLLLLAVSLWPRLRRIASGARHVGRSAWRRTRSTLASFPAGASFLDLLDDVRDFSRKLVATLGSALDRSSLSERSRQRLAMTLALGAVVAVEVVYVFIVSVGSWTRWPEETRYFHLLSDAFRAGQVHLLVDPDPALASVARPYEYASRAGIAVLRDATYYKGNYYLYWGPVPALVLAIAETLSGRGIGDHVLTFGFLTVVNVCLGWILYALWRQLFSSTWPILLPVAIGAAALAAPLPWLLGSPRVYEAAIAGGQAFFLVGLAVILPDLVAETSSPARFAVAGTAWAAAIGSRASLAPAVVLVAGWLGIRWLLRRAVSWGSILALLAPLTVGALALGWYNWFRFGNILETGLSYALAGWNDVSGVGDYFSASYIPSNLYNLVWMPIDRLSIFPFYKPQWGVLSVPILGLRPGGLYTTEQIAGIPRTTPLVWLALYPAVAILLRRGRRPAGPPPEQTSVALVLGLASAGSFVTLVAYFYSTMRFQADFLPVLVLLAIVGGWMAIQEFSRARVWAWMLSATFGLLALQGLIIGTLLAITGYSARFEHLEPVLFDQITRFFAP